MASSTNIEYESALDWSIWPIDRTVTSTKTPSQSGPGSSWPQPRFPAIELLQFEINSEISHKIKSLVYKDLEPGFGLVWFYGISTIVGYLMPNPVFTYILNI